MSLSQVGSSERLFCVVSRSVNAHVLRSHTLFKPDVAC